MQHCCIGRHMAMWFAASIPPSPTSGISPHDLSPRPPHSPAVPPLVPQQQIPVCDAPLPVSMCSHCSSPAYKWEHAVFFCSCVSLLRMMVSRFIHVPTKNTNSSFFMAAEYSMVYMCHIFLVQSIVNGHLDWFQFFAIVNSATMNIHVHVFIIEQFIILWEYTQ